MLKIPSLPARRIQSPARYPSPPAALRSETPNSLEKHTHGFFFVTFEKKSSLPKVRQSFLKRD